MSYSQSRSSLLSVLSENWWALLLRGIFALLFGLLALFLPGITLFVLVLLFGAYALVDGVFAVVAGIRGAIGGRMWALIIEGVLGVLACILAFVWPGITALALLYVIAFWAIFTGVAEVVATISLRREIEGEWALIAGGFSCQ
jgi:uncharacterized membrane protein HdeD (DUF308 family)